MCPAMISDVLTYARRLKVAQAVPQTRQKEQMPRTPRKLVEKKLRLLKVGIVDMDNYLHGSSWLP